MRIGVIFEPCPNAYYRAVDPAEAMARRGHEILLADASGDLPAGRLATCDVVHVYRRANDDTRRKLATIQAHGVSVVFDNDDDLSAIPSGVPAYRKNGGRRGGQQYFAMTVQAARQARVMTTTSEPLADRYRGAGVERVEVVPNALSPALARPRDRRGGITIGWVAGTEHAADLQHIDLVDALRRVIAAHPDVRVETIGIDLHLPERYEFRGLVPFLELPRQIGRYDIGLAPIADIPFNQVRSDIKVKEYAASGVPWLASPVGPYAGLGPHQGGLLVPDGGSFDALDRLVTHNRERRKLAKRGRAWAKRQTIVQMADRWEAVFERAVADR